MDWSVPESTVCDAFLVNYTILTLSKPQSFSVATTDDFALIKVRINFEQFEKLKNLDV